MKKFLLVLMLMCFFISSIEAQKNEFAGSLYWELNGDVLNISGHGRIPDYEDPWEKHKESIRKVVIENGVTYIGTYTFHDYKNIVSVQIPNSVTSMGSAFTGCSKLTNIVIPNSVTSIDGIAFYECPSLMSIVVPYVAGNSFGQERSSCTLYRTFDGPNQTTYFIVESGQQRGLKNADKWLIPLSNTYSDIVPLVDNYLLIKKNGRCGMITFDGREIVPAELDALEKCGTGFLRFKINGFWGVMNYAGKVIIPTDRGYTKIGDYVSFTKRIPYEMDGYKGECNNLGVQVSKIKVTAPKQTTTTSSSSSSTTSSSTTSSSSSSNKNNSSSGNTTQTIVVEHQHTPQPVQEWQACFGCGGMGTMGCDNCGGSGTKYIGDRLHRCSRCNGQGIIPCNICYGSKGKYITVYR